jgi:hypothetical protein
MYTKKAIKYNANGQAHLDCECGHAVSIPVIKGMPMTYVCGECFIEYDSRGYIISRPPAPEKIRA